jgi:hypothetical protein
MHDETHGVQRSKQSTETNFTIVANSLVRDGTLSIPAKMLAIYLLTHEVGYEVKFTQIERELGLGPKGFRSALTELTERNLIKAERTKNAAGQWSTYSYKLGDLSRVPSGTVAQSTVEQSTVAQGTVLRKQSLENTNIENTNIENTKTENRATKLPEDWFPDNYLLEMFDSKWTALVPNRDYHIENFRLYWLASGKPMKSWNLAFQKWMNTEQLRHSKKKTTTNFDDLEKWAREQDELEGRS